MIQTIKRQPRIEMSGIRRRQVWAWRPPGGWLLEWDIGQNPAKTDLAIHAFCPDPCDIPGETYMRHKEKCPWKLGRWAGRWGWRKAA